MLYGKKALSKNALSRYYCAAGNARFWITSVTHLSPVLTLSYKSIVTTGVATEGSNAPLQYILAQNYPNPFNPSTSIKYELPRASLVRLSVYDIVGREVSVLVNERKNAGSYQVKFDGAGLSSGVYFYRLHAGDFLQTRKLCLIR